jgi:hypothetical protein
MQKRCEFNYAPFQNNPFNYLKATFNKLIITIHEHLT